MRADVVVVTWNAVDLIGSCLERLLTECPAGWTITVADNGSTDGTPEFVARDFPVVRLLETGGNLGFGRGANAGAAGGTGEAIVLVNADAFVEPDCLAALVTPLAADPGVGMVAGLTLMPGAGAPLVDGFGIELDLGLAAYNRLRGRTPDSTPGVLAGPSGGLAAYRRAAWEDVGGFDEAFFAYGEDVDLALRLRAAGWRAAAAGHARAVHLGGASIGVDSPQQRAWAGFARGFLLRRYGVLRTAAAPRALLVDALVVGYGAMRHRSLVPLRARVAGWRRAGRAPTVVLDRSALNGSITLAEAVRRLRSAR